MINTIILGHALNVLSKLPAESVNCITTSPPYWSLRDYGVDPVIWDGVEGCKHEWSNNLLPRGQSGWHTFEHKYHSSGSHKTTLGSKLKEEPEKSSGHGQFCLKCNAWRGSLGLEPTFDLYIKHLCDIFEAIKRVLRKDGTCFVNIGDSYNGSKVGNTNASTGAIGKPKYSGDFTKTFRKENQNSIPTKSLCDIPYRFSIEMINRGWVKRNTIIWHKPNCMPASADDRFTVDFEYLFFFSKSNKTLFWTNEKTLECVSKKPPGTKGIEGKDWRWGVNSKGKPKKISFWTGHDYWFEQQFEELKEETIKDKRTINGYKNIRGRSWDKDPNSMFGKMGSMKVNPQGRNKRAVWAIPTQPFPEAHFAVYPDGLIEIPIKAGCPEFICKKCGKARVKIIRSKFTAHDGKINSKYDPKTKDGGAGRLALLRQAARERGEEYHQELEFLGYSDCGCNAGWESGIVLDPFIGSGTTAKEALKQRKRFIGIDIKQEYIDMAYKRIARVQQKIF